MKTFFSKCTKGVGLALVISALPLAVSAKTTAPNPSAALQLMAQVPAGTGFDNATPQAVKVALRSRYRSRIRRSFRAGQRGGWRTVRNRHGGANTYRVFRNFRSRHQRFRSHRRFRNRHGGP
ncbi:MAG TPA: hypothetical protein ENK48_00490 [Gammaproteobacteria bacterium]|nr:hypothetical protein [Gammaproteobacteria bacterium]